MNTIVNIQNTVVGSTFISEDTRLAGTIVGPVEVIGLTKFELNGSVIGNLTINKGSEVHILGTVHGDVINEGGILQVFGMINGHLIKNGGETFVSPAAMV
ncbi:hypothetical protein [Peribacillus loiseleuriae]|uniref:hypothetical protein n=1 Tax=Peribacillus loiseleuriae TaxID=1679170 RepID=UPI003D093F56